jgi:hypothetical protein
VKTSSPSFPHTHLLPFLSPHTPPPLPPHTHTSTHKSYGWLILFDSSQRSQRS